MKGRIHNGNVDIVIEGKTREEIMDKFQKQHPEEINNAIFIDWEGDERRDDQTNDR